MLLWTLFSSYCWFGITDQSLIFSTFAECSILGTQGWESITLLFDLDSFWSSWVYGSSFYNSKRNCLYFIFSWFGYFLKVKIIHHSFAAGWACVVWYFLVQVLIVELLCSLLKDDIDGIGDGMNRIVDLHD